MSAPRGPVPRYSLDVKASDIDMRLELVQHSAGVYLIKCIDDIVSNPQGVVGVIVRRKSWRMNDWYARISYGPMYYATACDDSLREVFDALPLRMLRRRDDCRHILGTRDEMLHSRKVLASELAKL